MTKNILFLFSVIILFAGCNPSSKTNQTSGTDETDWIKISDNNRFFMDEDGDPFFWLGDTAWLLGTKLNRQQVDKYLTDRHKKGFNVIQIIALPTVSSTNFYGDSALVNHNVSTPKTTPGNNPKDSVAYDYWDHIDYIVHEAADYDMQVALVAIWGGNVLSGHVNDARLEIMPAF